MKLRNSKSKVKFFDKNRNDNSHFFKEQIGLRFENNPLFESVITNLRIQNYQKVNKHLENLSVQDIDDLDTFRFRGEFFFTYFSYLSAWEQYDCILKVNPLDAEALVVSCACAYILNKKKAYLERINLLKYYYPHLAEKITYYLNLNKFYFNKYDFPTSFPRNTDIDLIILYGKKINDDGTLSNELKARMKKTLEAAEFYPNADIITLGGAVHNQYFEGEVLHNWLVDHDITPYRIVLDLTGLDLVSETAAVVEVVAQKKFNNILILSAPNDLPRHFLSLKATIHSHSLNKISIFPMNHSEHWSANISIKEQTKSWQSTLRSAGIFTDNFYRSMTIS